MENEYFYSAGIPPSLHFQHSLSPLQTPNGSHKPHFQKSTENYSHFQSAISSMVSSPATSNSPPIINRFVQENLRNLGNPMPMNSHLPILSTDPGFAERAAKFSCFGSRSFNGRTSQIGLNNGEFRNRSSGLVVRNGKLPRVSSTPSLNIAGSPMGVQEIKNSVQIQMEISAADGKLSNLSGSAANSNEDSSFSGQNPSGENGLSNQNELNSRKRKAVSRGKVKEAANSNSANATKADENSNVKKAKMTEEDQKPPEPPKDYIHVRARRGQATDSHSLAERVRREKIGERMKLLQDLVPGCNKVTGKALMLDEIINYVQSLQRQVECLSMKLATVNPRLDTDMDSLLSKDILQPNGTMPHQIYPVDLLASAYYGHQGRQNPQTLKSVEPLDATLCPNLGVQLDGFGQGLPQFPAFSEDELQSIFQMGFGPNQTSHMK